MKCTGGVHKKELPKFYKSNIEWWKSNFNAIDLIQIKQLMVKLGTLKTLERHPITNYGKTGNSGQEMIPYYFQILLINQHLETSLELITKYTKNQRR